MREAVTGSILGLILILGAAGCGGGSGGTGSGVGGSGSVSVEARTISAGWHHTCAVTAGGEVRCWGSNGHGELGNGSQSDERSPVTVLDSSGQPLKDVVSVSASRYYTCALKSDGHVWCWGWNEGGKLGDGKVDKTVVDPALRSYIPFDDEVNVTRAVEVKIDDNTPLSDAVSISAGSWHACALLKDGTVKCWGQNFDGALGIGKDPDSFDPFAAQTNREEFKKLFWPFAVTVVENNSSTAPLSGAKQVAAGSSDHTCVLLNDGTVKCWAWNGGDDGELGIDDRNITFTTAPSLKVVDENGTTLGSVEKIAAGGDFTCALLSDGTVKCWGWNVSGQLGNDDNISMPHAVAVKDSGGNPLSGVKDIFSERGNHTCALMSDGNVTCWGDNSRGQLGTGSAGGYIAHAVRVDLSAIKEEITALAVGGGGRDPLSSAPVQYEGDHTCAITTSKKVWCWGSNDRGQLGDGTTVDSSSPVQVQGL